MEIEIKIGVLRKQHHSCVRCRHTKLPPRYINKQRKYLEPWLFFQILCYQTELEHINEIKVDSIGSAFLMGKHYFRISLLLLPRIPFAIILCRSVQASALLPPLWIISKSSGPHALYLHYVWVHWTPSGLGPTTKFFFFPIPEKSGRRIRKPSNQKKWPKYGLTGGTTICTLSNTRMLCSSGALFWTNMYSPKHGLTGGTTICTLSNTNKDKISYLFTLTT